MPGKKQWYGSPVWTDSYRLWHYKSALIFSGILASAWHRTIHQHTIINYVVTKSTLRCDAASAVWVVLCNSRHVTRTRKRPASVRIFNLKPVRYRFETSRYWFHLTRPGWLACWWRRFANNPPAFIAGCLRDLIKLQASCLHWFGPVRWGKVVRSVWT